ncbi:MAG TPA: YraN family protein, partial [Polyangia bacterium]
MADQRGNEKPAQESADDSPAAESGGVRGALDKRPARGRRAEEAAAALLEGKGFQIVARNWRLPTGELDLVADDGGTCVFVEVRSRTGS